MPPTPEVFDRLAAFLSSGGLVAVPTETVYGLAANGLDSDASREIFRVKQRPPTDPLILHLRDLSQAHELAQLNANFHALAAAFWPGPLTLIVPKRSLVPDCVTAGGPTVALRMPAHPVMRLLLEKCNFPLAAPSANPFGYISPTRPQHVLDSLGGQIRYILDGGPCEIGLESTIVDLSGEQPALLRPGRISAEALTQALGTPVATERTQTAEGETAKAPGTLERHYSPRKPLELFAGSVPAEAANDPQAGVIFLNAAATTTRSVAGLSWALSRNGDPEEAGRNLFHILRLADTSDASRLFAEAPTESPAGTALLDRLQRAATRI